MNLVFLNFSHAVSMGVLAIASMHAGIMEIGAPGHAKATRQGDDKKSCKVFGWQHNHTSSFLKWFARAFLITKAR